MSTVPQDNVAKPINQPDLGGKQQPVTGKGHIDLRVPSGPGVIGPKPDVPALGPKRK